MPDIRFHYTTLPKQITVTCPNCETDQTTTLLQDEDTGACYGEMYTSRCGLSDCKAELCYNCPQFECAFCHQSFCQSHAILYSGQMICPDCIAEEATGMEVMVREVA